MIEEPYRWVEAIANRREYIEHQLAAGSPIVALTYKGGILLFALSRERQKIFEIYDRIAMGGIGHPGDIERLRMTSIELCSTEGFTRSSHDVSLRRLANYSLSPALKTAFEQVYGAPYLARLIFAEMGRGSAPNVYLRLDYDGSIHTNGGAFGHSFEEFGVIAGSKSATKKMERYLAGRDLSKLSMEDALKLAADAWAVGHLVVDGESEELPSDEAISQHRNKQLEESSVECAVLDRESTLPVTWRSISENEAREILNS